MNRILITWLLIFTISVVYSQQWEKVGPYNGNGPIIEDLQQDHTNHTILYASTNTEGIYKSIDKGETWFKISPDYINGQMSALAMAPDNSEVIYSGGSDGHIYKSSNGGTNWQEISGSLPTQQIRDIEINPANSGQVFVALSGTYANDGGLFVTENNGDNWEEISQSFENKDIYSIEICPDSPSLILAGTEQNSIYGILYKSSDGGMNWTEVLSANIRDIKFDPNDSEKIIAVSWNDGIYISENLGESWSHISGENFNYSHLYKVAFNSFIEDLLFVVCQRPNDFKPAVYKSTDGGLNWIDSDQGLEASGVFSIIIDKQNGQNIFCGSTIGFYKSENWGELWNWSINGMKRLYAGEILIKNDNPDHWLVLTDQGLQLTENNGLDWDVVSYLKRPKFYVPNTNIVYGFIGAGSYSDGVYISNDDGYTWQVLEWIMDVTDLEIANSNPTRLLVSTNDWIGITSDGGSNWIDADIGIDEYPVNCIEINQFHPDTVYAASPSKIFKTTTAGNLWFEMPGPFSTPEHSPVTLDTDPFVEEKIYVGTPSALIISENGGLDWTVHDLPASDFKTLALSNVYEKVLFAGFDTSGVFYSLDGGEDWTEMNEGLLGQKINYLAISPHSDFLLCGTYRDALYKSELLFLGTEQNSIANDKLLTVFPIPGRDQIHISTEGNVSFIEIYTIGGELFKKSEKTDIIISDLAPGVYYLVAHR